MYMLKKYKAKKSTDDIFVCITIKSHRSHSQANIQVKSNKID